MTEYVRFRAPLRLRSLVLVAATGIVLSVASGALAQVSCGDKTCAKGFECEAMEMMLCTGRDPGAVEGDIPESCTSSISYACTPADCTSDADCADGMVCYASTIQTCTGTAVPACPRDAAECVTPEVTEPTCTSTVRQACTPRYQVPCTAAADCGPGFTCEEQQTCWCSGSGGSSAGGNEGSGATPTAAGGTPAVPTRDPADPSSGDSNCGCAPSGTFACRLQTISCSANADCPAGLECQDNPARICWASSDGTSGCTEPDPAKTCQPISYDASAGGSSGGIATTKPSQGASPSGTTANPESPPRTSWPWRPAHFAGCSFSAEQRSTPTSMLSLILVAGLALRAQLRRKSK